MQKPVASAAAAAVFLFGLVAGFLDVIEKASTAAELYDFAVANVQVHVHWPTIYLFLTILGACLFIGLNWGWLVNQHAEWKRRNKRSWDQALILAAKRILHDSNTRHSFSKGTEISETIAMIESNARRGHITLAGRRKGSGDLEVITPKIWKSSRLLGRVSRDYYDRPELDVILLVSNQNESDVVMSGLMADYSQIHGTIR